MSPFTRDHFVYVPNQRETSSPIGWVHSWNDPWPQLTARFYSIRVFIQTVWGSSFIINNMYKLWCVCIRLLCTMICMKCQKYCEKSAGWCNKSVLKLNMTKPRLILRIIHCRPDWTSNNIISLCPVLTHLSLDKMADISQTTFSNEFSWMKSFVFWSLFLRVPLTIFQHWLR